MCVCALNRKPCPHCALEQYLLSHASTQRRTEVPLDKKHMQLQDSVHLHAFTLMQSICMLWNMNIFMLTCAVVCLGLAIGPIPHETGRVISSHYNSAISLCATAGSSQLFIKCCGTVYRLKRSGLRCALGYCRKMQHLITVYHSS